MFYLLNFLHFNNDIYKRLGDWEVNDILPNGMYSFAKNNHEALIDDRK